MNLSEQNFTKYHPEEQLELLKLQCKKLSPKLYKQKELYLHYLRLILPRVVRQSVYLLLTDRNDYLLNSYSSELKQSALKNIDLLISKSISFLTIEQLMILINDLEKEQKDKLKKKQEIILNELKLSQDNNHIEETINNSIELESNPPINDMNRLDSSFLNNEKALEEDIDFQDYEEVTEKQSPEINILKREQDKQNNSDLLQLDSNQSHRLDIIKKIFRFAGKTISPKAEDSIINNEKNDLDNSSQNNTLLPDNPVELFNWMNSMDSALKRVLRNLSNSINVELLTAGFLNNLVPVSLLDAVIDGQILTHDSPSNILKLSIPINSSIPEEGVDVTCLLLRPSELEFDFPKLRQYRSLLKKNRNILVKMIKQHRHWQNRLFADDVSQQWLQSPQDITKTNQVKY